MTSGTSKDSQGYYQLDRKSTRLNSSHSQISYAVSLDRKSTRLNSIHSQISKAVFCLKKKKPSKSGQQCRRYAVLSLKHKYQYPRTSPGTVLLSREATS